MRYGSLIRQAREERGIGLRQMARELGISAPYLSDVERGRRAAFREHLAVRVAKFFDLPELLEAAQDERGEFWRSTQ